MKVVGIAASPREGGNSEILLDQALKGAEDEGLDVSKYVLNTMDISPCQDCETCASGLDCAQGDDCNDLLAEILEADAIIFASPIYFGQVTAQAKMFMDRLYSIARHPKKDIDGKDAVLIFTYGAPKGTYDQYIELTKASPFAYMGMEVFEVLDVGDVHEPGEVNSNKEALEEAYEIGSSI